MEIRHNGYHDLLESIESSNATYLDRLRHLHGHLSQEASTLRQASSLEEPDLNVSDNFAWSTGYGFDGMDSIESVPTLIPNQVQELHGLQARRRPEETNLGRELPLEPLHCHFAECNQERNIRDLDLRPDLIYPVLTLVLNLHQQIQAKRKCGMPAIEVMDQLGQLRHQWTELALKTCLGTSNLVSDPTELVLSAKPEPSSKLYADMQNFQQFQDVFKNRDIMLPLNETADDADGIPNGVIALRSTNQLQPDFRPIVSPQDNRPNDFSSPELIERSSVNRKIGTILPGPLVSAMADVVATFASYCATTPNVVSTLTVNTDKDCRFSKQLNLTDHDCERWDSRQSIPTALPLHG